jgi:hypothetical protein
MVSVTYYLVGGSRLHNHLSGRVDCAYYVRACCNGYHTCCLLCQHWT